MMSLQNHGFPVFPKQFIQPYFLTVLFGFIDEIATTVGTGNLLLRPLVGRSGVCEAIADVAGEALSSSDEILSPFAFPTACFPAKSKSATESCSQELVETKSEGALTVVRNCKGREVEVHLIFRPCPGCCTSLCYLLTAKFIYRYLPRHCYATAQLQPFFLHNCKAGFSNAQQWCRTPCCSCCRTRPKWVNLQPLCRLEPVAQSYSCHA